AVIVHLVVLPDPRREEAVEGGDDVGAEARVGILVDDDGRGGGAHEDGAEALGHARARDDVGDLAGEVAPPLRLARLDPDRLLHRRSSAAHSNLTAAAPAWLAS